MVDEEYKAAQKQAQTAMQVAMIAKNTDAVLRSADVHAKMPASPSVAPASHK